MAKSEKEFFANSEKKKELFLKVYRKTLGNVTMACNAVGIKRAAYYYAMEVDSIFEQEIMEADESQLDFGESKLKERMQKGDIQAIKFFLETKGAIRGYTKDQSLKIKGSKEEPLQLDGSLDIKLIQQAAIEAVTQAIDEY